MRVLQKKEILLISLMLFSMFFGAGNLIFPPFLGYEAGEYVWISLIGFIISATGLPILGVVAVAKAGSFQALGERVHRSFAIVFPCLVYVFIGPGLGIPRAGSLAFEMGFGSFFPEPGKLVLLVYTVVFFSIVYWLSLSPSRLMDLFGKVLTPLLLCMIALIFIKSMITPVGALEAPLGNYGQAPMFQGFLDGYLTMDALAALIFGIVVANAVQEKGIKSDKSLAKYMSIAGVGAGLLLSIIYIILGYVGSISGSLGQFDNGAKVLAGVMTLLFGQSGVVLLGIIFTIACLCVSVGLVTSCSQFFTSVFPKIPYKVWGFILSFISMFLANLGLTEILKVSVPILGFIYPVALMLIILGLFHKKISRYAYIYPITIGSVALFSAIDIVNRNVFMDRWTPLLKHIPFYTEGVGWLVPATVSACLGIVISVLVNKKD
ncbi:MULTISPECIES: branched-chain amino acid transport system II carrier protein BrnQ1 [Bacillus cereus group]|uniref:branched-chain amino acid transport system II carrier protein BrnQ1 n=1 Tax=Bacillus cereus group TaxID=86661 RepID=UPI000660276C|nr:branched-chain amino acid transport system II carrier protein [Bacillus cytotoxicus]AWC31575.1 branched-chain amino acid transport system II carrier protein [Bacillus cytotoxicus]AWC35615.1 branched-chain amino acid transport system II carrier protein [Bacillus cytotoxicus]AWC59847.1 branched-chain amino acid transport system II carrier protein [Bacillus cytotoxicus]KMT49954.1 branched-chain amino acid transporter [Bacillus cytotoxicus]MDH2880042.1 branched-chain amino acid transport system